MLRGIFNVLAVLSLLMVLVTLLFWKRNAWYDEGFMVWQGGVGFGLSTSYGEAELLIPDPSLTNAGARTWCSPPYPSRGFLPIARYVRYHNVSGGTTIYHYPFWFVILIFSWLPAVWLLYRCRDAQRRRQRIRTGLCVSCGYDLRGTTAAGRTECPECGAAIQDPSPLRGERAG